MSVGALMDAGLGGCTALHVMVGVPAVGAKPGDVVQPPKLGLVDMK